MTPRPPSIQKSSPSDKIRKSPLPLALIALGVIGINWVVTYYRSASKPISTTTSASGTGSATPEIRKAKPVLSPSQSDPVAEYWEQFDRLHRPASDTEVAANLRAREAAARAKITAEAANRREEYLTLVPHKLTKAWIAGIRTDKIGADLLAERGVTEGQLADLIRWYVGCNASVVTVYDNAENARKRESMLASYMCGDANDCTQFERFTYPKGKDWQLKSVTFR